MGRGSRGRGERRTHCSSVTHARGSPTPDGMVIDVVTKCVILPDAIDNMNRDRCVINILSESCFWLLYVACNLVESDSGKGNASVGRYRTNAALLGGVAAVLWCAERCRHAVGSVDRCFHLISS